jgi:hypothetical protein
MILDYVPLYCCSLRRASISLWKTAIRHRVHETLTHFGLSHRTLNVINEEEGYISGSQALAMALAIKLY